MPGARSAPRLAPARVVLQPEGAGTPFHCVHPGAGGVLCYAELARALGRERPFAAFESPALRGVRPLPASVGELAAHYLEELAEARPAGPYLLGGWSMGGMVAFEMARRLAAAGERVGMVALIDADFARPEDERDDEAVLVRMFAGSLRLALTAAEAAALAQLDEEARLRVLLARARGAGVLPPDAPPEEMRGMYDVFRGNVRAMWSYAPGPYAGAVHLFTAAGVPGRPADLGWGRWAPGVVIHPVPGDHFTLVRPPSVEVLAARLAALLRSAEGEG